MTGREVRFGTSGLRGPAHILADRSAFDHTFAFLNLLRERRSIGAGDRVLLACDLRDSSEEILARCVEATNRANLIPVNCGQVATPALALHAFQSGAAAIMVTGSHISADRNGLKFFKPGGEIDKRDEEAIRVQVESASTVLEASVRRVDSEKDRQASATYIRRYLDYFGSDDLTGLRVGVWQHSSILRDALVAILRGLGAHTIPVGRATSFVPVDTEALSEQHCSQLRQWVVTQRLDAIVSTDADGDRPIFIGSDGEQIAGDLLGVVTAHALGAEVIATPVTSNSAIERIAQFQTVRRCRVGSPFVIEALTEHVEAGKTAAGFEANGGFLLASTMRCEGRRLDPLLTRDSVLPILMCLRQMARHRKPLEALGAEFSFRARVADRLEEVGAASGALFLSWLKCGGHATAMLETWQGVRRIEDVDGVRLLLGNGGLLHFRLSGNAPELRCYAEAQTLEDARRLRDAGLLMACEFLAHEAAA